MNKSKVAFFPLVIGCIISILLITKGEKMENAWWVGILVGLISVAGAILVALFQFKKDSNTIGSVKSDTVLIPNIVDDAKRSREVICEEILPKFKDSEGFIKQINEIAKEVDYRKRLSQESSYISSQTSDTLITSILTMEKKIVEQQIKLQEKDMMIKKLNEQLYTLQSNQERSRKRDVEGPEL